MGTSFDNF